jgi:hypothetical protein
LPLAANSDCESLIGGKPLAKATLSPDDTIPMSATALSAAPDHRLARAFLALADEVAPEPVKRSLITALAAAAAILALAVAAPLSWMAPVARTPQKAADQPAATLSSSKAAFHAADDEDDAGN